MKRKIPHVTNEVYHVYSRSIAQFKIFNHPNEFHRMMQLLEYYRINAEYAPPFSVYLKKPHAPGSSFAQLPKLIKRENPLVRIIAFCLMETHLHLALQQTAPDGIPIFMQRVLTGYSKFFNALHKRKGPLTESRYQSRHVNSNEYLLHLTRYIHLNPVKAGLVAKAENWEFSSYKNYIGLDSEFTLCDFKKLVPYSDVEYKKITEDHADYLSSLGKIKNLLIDGDGP